MFSYRTRRVLTGLVLLGCIGFGVRVTGFQVWGWRELSSAQAALDRRDFATAQAHLDAYLSVWADHEETLLLSCRTARRAGDFARAAERLRRYAETSGDRDGAEFETRLDRLTAGDPTEAAPALAFCRSSPGNPLTPLVLEAVTVGALKTGNAAVAAAALGLWSPPAANRADRAQIAVWRGTLSERGGEPEKALVAYRQAVDLDPANDDARVRLAELLVHFGPAEARGMLEDLVGRFPGRPELALDLARCRRNLGDLDGARQLLDGLLGAAPDDVTVLAERANLALDLRDPAGAERWLRRAVTLAPDRRDPNCALVRCYQELGRDADAARQLARLAAIDAALTARLKDATSPRPAGGQ